jgi:tryptophan-rich hypothetical protein
LNRITPKKLLNSKWTALHPRNREKHFLVSDVEFDEDGVVTLCLLEAVISKRSESIDWRDLKNTSVWTYGWR